ncbi:MAG: Na+/H+ antiporter NhaC [Prevotellamassilia sp.]|nr:Na+/H+ antiporter NhaC [Prevotellamassilia sp.]
MNKKRHLPSPLISLLPLVVLVLMLVATIRAYGSDSLLGASQVTLLVVSAFCVLLGTTVLGVPWADFERMITKNVASVTSAIIILLLIGALSGTWMVSGVVPSLIYYGVKIIHPDVFLASTCIISALVSVMTGSSWTTIATIGIALMGIGRAQGFDDGWIAGAIISGAYFGDKISPLSDTTVLASGAVGVPIFKHIRYMLITTIPSLVISLIIFTFAGFMQQSNSSAEIEQFTSALAGRFHISAWLLVVPVLTGVMIARKVPPIATLFLSTLLAVVFSLVFQSDALHEIAGGDLFKGAMQSVYGQTSLSTSNPMLTSLVATRGMAGMMGTIWLIICAMCFGGAMEAGGMVRGITQMFVRMIRGRVSLVASTVCSGLMLNLAVADQYICVLLTGNMFKKIYDRQQYERRLLSRTTEDSVTVTSVLVPWNTCGMTQSTVLGVPTLTYLPYCFFNLISPLMSICVAALGYKIWRTTNSISEKEEHTA